MPTPKHIALVLLLLVTVASPACAPSDPKAEILEQRMRWDVTVLNWAQDEQGGINISTRVSGPPNSDLRYLTVRVDLLDPGDNVIGDYWHTFDLEQVPRGGPADLYIRIPQASPLTVGLVLDMMLEPDPEEQARLVELQPDSASE
jgi:hypothetical protein